MAKKKQNQKGFGVDFDYVSFEKEAITGLQNGAGLVGTTGVLTGMIERLVNAALTGEVQGQLNSDKSSGLSNRRNGHLPKQLKTELGAVDIQTPRYRLGHFEPQSVGKPGTSIGNRFGPE